MPARSRGRSTALIVIGVIVVVLSILALTAGGQILWWISLAAGIIALVIGVIDLARNRGTKA
ncbi:hypothetical protein [Orlajensenia leifsoniae]|uniref:Uncharacterized protein n=1 Tax=Orlajensenia leifsoniae TaxID=2561933 RepID=A0A4Y9QRE4_9MICO|nr:hypothetical protein [Leifsonia flava]TFV94860.1 hypothetical protein E4M00_17040 [Leifsonia flava]